MTQVTEREHVTTVETLAPALIESYRRDGFVKVPNVLSACETGEYYEAALLASQQLETYSNQKVFTQLVNVWQRDAAMRQLTLHPNIAAIAEHLAGVALRLWHDQILIKQPHNEAPTEFHQDQPYWPHQNSVQPITAWIALCDIPVERGCMTFIPGSQRYTDLSAQSLVDARSLFNLCPELQWEPRVTLPLKAGDCTFHHGRCAHMATPNLTDDPRVAHAIIFIDTATEFSGKAHVVTKPLGLEEGQPLDGTLFPSVAEFAVARRTA